MTSERRGPLAAIALLGLAIAALAIVAATRSATAQEPAVQRAAETIVPEPSEAGRDRGRPDRCPSRTQLGAKLRCIYGKRRSDTNMVVFGDSKVMQYFPALNQIAHRREWRLVGLMRAGCPPMVVKYAYRCDTWRKRNMRRLRRIDPEVIVTSSGTAYQIVRRGKRLSRKRSGPILRRAYIRTLRGFVRRGAEVAVLINPPRSRQHPVDCVLANREALDACAFERGSKPYRNYVTKAARRAGGVTRLDVNQVACPGRVCRAVMDDILVFRDRVHLTATYVRTLVDWIDKRLPAVE